MATAKLYSLVPETQPKKALTGQAKQVWEELSADPTPRLATDIDAQVGPKFKTRQDTLRVTLYYLLVFKKQGLVQAAPQAKAEPVAVEPAPTTEELEETISAS